ncbi:MAG: hypothetical protein ABR968_00280 [Bacteroidales bacterium]
MGNKICRKCNRVMFFRLAFCLLFACFLNLSKKMVRNDYVGIEILFLRNKSGVSPVVFRRFPVVCSPLQEVTLLRKQYEKEIKTIQNLIAMKTTDKIKILPLFALVLLPFSNIFSQSSPGSDGTVFTTVALAGSSASWNNPANAATENGIYSSTDNIASNGDYSDYLVATGFTFNIPDNARITGIEVTFYKNSDNLPHTHDHSVRIIKGGTIGGDEKAFSSSWEKQGNPVVYGGNNDLWGETWTPADINSDNFGIALSAERQGNGGGSMSAEIDYIKINIIYDFGLPIELLSFNALPSNGSVLLKWVTASETNNDYFTIERSANGMDFSTAGTVAGAGNSNNLKEYSFTDENPFSTIYYRLKQTDFNGAFTYSDIILVTTSGNKTAGVGVNATDGILHVTVNNAVAGPLQVNIFNTAGALVYGTETHIGSGSSTVDLSTSLPVSIYIVKVSMNNMQPVTTKVFMN